MAAVDNRDPSTSSAATEFEDSANNDTAEKRKRGRPVGTTKKKNSPTTTIISPQAATEGKRDHLRRNHGTRLNAVRNNIADAAVKIPKEKPGRSSSSNKSNGNETAEAELAVQQSHSSRKRSSEESVAIGSTTLPPKKRITESLQNNGKTATNLKKTGIKNGQLKTVKPRGRGRPRRNPCASKEDTTPSTSAAAKNPKAVAVTTAIQNTNATANKAGTGNRNSKTKKPKKKKPNGSLKDSNNKPRLQLVFTKDDQAKKKKKRVRIPSVDSTLSLQMPVRITERQHVQKAQALKLPLEINGEMVRRNPNTIVEQPNSQDGQQEEHEKQKKMQLAEDSADKVAVNKSLSDFECKETSREVLVNGNSSTGFEDTEKNNQDVVSLPLLLLEKQELLERSEAANEAVCGPQNDRNVLLDTEWNDETGDSVVASTVDVISNDMENMDDSVAEPESTSTPAAAEAGESPVVGSEPEYILPGPIPFTNCSPEDAEAVTSLISLGWPSSLRSQSQCIDNGNSLPMGTSNQGIANPRTEPTNDNCVDLETKKQEASANKPNKRKKKPVKEKDPLSHIQELSVEGKTMYECTICQQTFSTKNYHAACGNYKDESLKCKQCGHYSKNKNLLTYHERLHTGERPYKCHECGLSFIQNCKRIRHINLVHKGIRNYLCKFCGKNYATRQQLRIHIRIHTGENPFECTICKRAFRSLAYLKRHEFVHKESCDRYQCTFNGCTKSFVSNYSMIQHLNAYHINERGFSCEQCNMEFKVYKDLARHKECLHLRTKLYICITCISEFTRKDNLYRHLRTVHKIKDEDFKVNFMEKKRNFNAVILEEFNSDSTFSFEDNNTKVTRGSLATGTGTDLKSKDKGLQSSAHPSPMETTRRSLRIRNVEKTKPGEKETLQELDLDMADKTKVHQVDMDMAMGVPSTLAYPPLSETETEATTVPLDSEADRDISAVDKIMVAIQNGISIENLDLTEKELETVQKHSQALGALAAIGIGGINSASIADKTGISELSPSSASKLAELSAPKDNEGSANLDCISGPGTKGPAITNDPVQKEGDDKENSDNDNGRMQNETTDDLKLTGESELKVNDEDKSQEQDINLESEKELEEYESEEEEEEESEEEDYDDDDDDDDEVLDGNYSDPEEIDLTIEDINTNANDAETETDICPQLIDQTKEIELDNHSYNAVPCYAYTRGAKLKQRPPPLLRRYDVSTFEPEGKSARNSKTEPNNNNNRKRIQAGATKRKKPDKEVQVQLSYHNKFLADMNEHFDDYFDWNNNFVTDEEKLACSLEVAIAECEREYWSKYYYPPIIPSQEFISFFEKVVKQILIENNGNDLRSKANNHGLKLLFECYKRGILDKDEQLHTTQTLTRLNEELWNQQDQQRRRSASAAAAN